MIVVRYRPRDVDAERNQSLVEAVFDQLVADRPDGVRYACLRLNDGTFVHIADITGEGNPLVGLDTFVAFSSTVADRCDPDDGPNAQPATVVGNYRLIG